MVSPLKVKSVAGLLVMSIFWGGDFSVAHAGPRTTEWGRARFHKGQRDKPSFPGFLAKTVVHAGMQYYYHHGYFYRQGWGGYVMVDAPVGVMVPDLPYGYSIIVVNGKRYFYYNRPYFVSGPRGYVVVDAPSYEVFSGSPPVYVLEEPRPADPVTLPGSYTINIPGSQGRYVPLTFKRQGTGFIGPQGEYYPQFPSVEELKIVYGTYGN